MPEIHLFGLPVIVKKTTGKGGYLAMFPGNRFHIQGFALTQQQAVTYLGQRLYEIIEGTRNVI